ncbi:MAG TPA: acyl-CoA dehydrogenase family protein, partial [Alphaproteobacteria bacterium]|nr:acyl-CoA dehydrogenase family protein [Alphaproteobacteria bacterium]
EAETVEMTELRILSRLNSGQRTGPESSLLKCRGTDVLQAITELAMEAVAYYMMPFDPDVLAFGRNEPPVGPDYAASLAGKYFNTRKVSIYGGSNEIQRGIMAKLILGM